MIKNFIKKAGLQLLALLPDQTAVQLLYLRKFGRVCRFKAPQTFNEKINWRKIYQRDERFVTFIDKVKVKEEISKLIGQNHVIPTLWSGDSPEDIPFDELLLPCVIKTNHGCNDAIFLRTRADIKPKDISAQLNKANKIDHSKTHREWAYGQIKPQILVERMLINTDGSIPADYKFFVYHGKAKFIQIDTNRFGNHKMAFLDEGWNKLPFTKGYPQIQEEIPKPQNYSKMVDLAETIGKLFDFVRVDFYDHTDGVFFGETTFYPAGGFGRFYPSEWDDIFGEPWLIQSRR